MNKVEVVMTHSKSVKHSEVYKASNEEAVNALYVKKLAVGSVVPKQIKVTIEEV